jgi:hypothetical protein
MVEDRLETRGRDTSGRATVREVYALVDSRSEVLADKIDALALRFETGVINNTKELSTLNTFVEIADRRINRLEQKIESTETIIATARGNLIAMKGIAGASAILLFGSIGATVLGHIWT